MTDSASSLVTTGQRSCRRVALAGESFSQLCTFNLSLFFSHGQTVTDKCIFARHAGFKNSLVFLQNDIILNMERKPHTLFHYAWIPEAKSIKLMECRM